jgi:hypothetical protein
MSSGFSSLVFLWSGGRIHPGTYTRDHSVRSSQADQDRGPRRASRPRHHLPTHRGRGNRPNGARHPCRNPPIASATVVWVTAIQAKIERKRQDRSACCAEKRRRRARMLRAPGPIRQTPGAFTISGTTQKDKKHLFSGQIQPILRSSGSQLGECRFRTIRTTRAPRMRVSLIQVLSNPRTPAMSIRSYT